MGRDRELFQEASRLQGEGAFEKSIPLLSEYTRLFPGQASGYFRLGIAYRRCSKPEDALKQFLQAVRLQPSNIRMRTFLFQSYSQLQKFDDANQVAHDTCELVGWSCTRSKEYKFAIECVFPERVKTIRSLVSPLVGKDYVSFAEVGSLEGLSSCWWLDNVLTAPTSRLYCIDPCFQENFWHNIEASGAKEKVTTFEEFSQIGLPKLDAGTLDLVYIDGLHVSWAVLFDFLMALPAVKLGGLVVFDDYDKSDQSGVGQTVRKAVDFILNIATPQLFTVESSTAPIAIRRLSAEIPPEFISKVSALFKGIYGLNDRGLAWDEDYLNNLSWYYGKVYEEPLVQWPETVLEKIVNHGNCDEAS